MVWDRFIRYAELPIPKDLVRWNPISPLMNRLARLLPDPQAAKWIEYQGYRQFDCWAARRLSRLKNKPQAVIAYENSALETFKMAKSIGAITILDAASIHHRTQDEVSGYGESAASHACINLNKDKEIELSNYVLTVSELGRESYLRTGVPPDQVFGIPLGADLDLFKISNKSSGVALEAGEFIFLFSGSSLSLRKGIDILLNAFRQVRTTYPSAVLKLVGSDGDASHLFLKKEPGVLRVGAKTQQELANEYQNAHCLVLPSRHDSFGMVVAEALAIGIPVIVSTMVGAKELIHKEGEGGWIVPAGDVGALAERMQWCVQHRDILASMREQCRQLASNVSWTVYHERLISLISLWTGPKLKK